jgi:hypothetical protein
MKTGLVKTAVFKRLHVTVVIPVPNEAVIAVVHYPTTTAHPVTVSDAVIRRRARSGVTSGDIDVGLSQ